MSLQSSTNSDIQLYVNDYPGKMKYSLFFYCFVTVYCINFIIFLCVIP